MFLERVGYKSYPPKTDEWQSATDLMKDKSFPMTGVNIITKKLAEFQDEMPEYIQVRRPLRGQSGLCLHKKGRQEFLKRVNEQKKKSLIKGKIAVIDKIQKTIQKIVPDNQHKK